MLISYFVPIAFVYYNYNRYGAKSISSIITSEEPLFILNNEDGGGGIINIFSTQGSILFIAASRYSDP